MFCSHCGNSTEDGEQCSSCQQDLLHEADKAMLDESERTILEDLLYYQC